MKFAYINILPDNYQDLVKYIGQENIFKLVFKDVSFDKKYTSPFRPDKNPGAFFKLSQNGNIQFVDYGDPITKYYGWADAIQSYYGLKTFQEAVDFIRETFRTDHNGLSPLGVVEQHPSGGSHSYTPVIKPIHVQLREWSLQDKIYWSAYGISKQQLIDDRVVPLELFSVMSRSGLWYSKRPFSITYGYLFPEERVKVYSPLATNPGEKWFTNCLSSDIGNWDNINWEDDSLIISKSYKDCRVLRNLGYNAIWFQSENQTPPIEVLLKLMSFKKLITFFDNDNTGIKSSDALKTLLNSLKEGIGEEISIPLEYGVKDISDFYKKYGEERTKEILIKLLKF